MKRAKQLLDKEEDDDDKMVGGGGEEEEVEEPLTDESPKVVNGI